jgi:hypothetical protein
MTMGSAHWPISRAGATPEDVVARAPKAESRQCSVEAFFASHPELNERAGGIGSSGALWQHRAVGGESGHQGRSTAPSARSGAPLAT